MGFKNPFKPSSKTTFSELSHYGGEWATNDHSVTKTNQTIEFSAQRAISGALVTNLNADMLDGLHSGAFVISGSNVYYLSGSKVADSDLLDGQHGSYYAISGAYPTLDQIGNPVASKTFTFPIDKTLTFRSNDNTPTTDTGIFNFEAIGNFTGDLVHIHQHTGNCGDCDLLHIEGIDTDAMPLSISGTNARSIMANKRIETTGLISGAGLITGTISGGAIICGNISGANIKGGVISGSKFFQGNNELELSGASIGKYVLSGSTLYGMTVSDFQTLGNDSMVDSLHRHSELSASDGSPNPALTIATDGSCKFNASSFITNNSDNFLAFQCGETLGQANSFLLTTPYGATGHNLCFNALYDGTEGRWEYCCGTGNHFGAAMGYDGSRGNFLIQGTSVSGANGSAASFSNKFAVDYLGHFTLYNTTKPTATAAAGIIYISGGALWFMGGSGTNTRIAVA